MIHAAFPTHSDAAPPHNPLPFSRRRSTVPLVCGPSAGEPAPPAFTFAGAPVAALEDVMHCRLEQIERWGHTPETDRDKPLVAFLVDVRAYATAAREDLQFHDRQDDRGLPQVRQRLVKLAALTLATIDRIDAERGR